MKKVTTTEVKEFDAQGKLIKHTETKVTEESVEANPLDNILKSTPWYPKITF